MLKRPGGAAAADPTTGAGPASFARERALYERFVGRAPGRIVRVRHPRLMPPVVVALGDLIGLIYRSNRGPAERTRSYIHFMEDPPRLVVDGTGRHLYVVGGSYRVTESGIEG